MFWSTIDLVANDHEVHDRSLRRHEPRLRKLTASPFLLFFLLAAFLIHNRLYPVEQFAELILLVALDVPVEASLYFLIWSGYCARVLRILLLLLLFFLC